VSNLCNAPTTLHLRRQRFQFQMCSAEHKQHSTAKWSCLVESMNKYKLKNYLFLFLPCFIPMRFISLPYIPCSPLAFLSLIYFFIIIIIIISYYYYILTANGFSPGGSGTTIRHNTQTTHITQNNTTFKQNTVHKNTHTMNTLHRMKIQQSQLQLYKVVLIEISML
jgi:hypothetical protein